MREMGRPEVANSEEERIVMDIEVNLKEDADGELRSSVEADIDEQLATLDAAMRRGAPPAEYTRLATLKTGLESARHVLVSAWSHFHR